MNQQTSRLLTLLLDSPDRYFKQEELAEQLNVSTRSIRNYVQNIQDFLESHQKSHTLSVSKCRLAFTGTPEERAFLLQAAVDNDFYLYRLSPEERTGIILLHLLILDGYCNLQELSDKFNVSRTTILQDMAQVKQFMDRYGLKFCPSLNKGYRLDIKEQQRRDMILRLVQSSMGSVFSLNRQVNIYERYLYDELQLNQYFPFLKEKLLALENLYGLEVSDGMFEELLLYLALSLARILAGRIITDTEMEQQTFQNMEVHKLAETLYQEICRSYRCTLTQDEVNVLAAKLYYCRFYNRPPLENISDLRLHVALNDFLLQLGDELAVPFCQDRQMTEQLENHLRDIYKARMTGTVLQNDYTEQMIREYPGYYQTIRRHVHILESCMGYPFEDDDVALILIYLVVAVERYCQSDILPRVIVVCHAGIATANFLAERLKSNFNIQIVAVVSNHKLSDAENLYDFDLIISTVSLEARERHWIKVSPMLDDEDLLKLQKLFIDIKKRKSRLHPSRIPEAPRPSVPGLSELLTPDNILLDVCCESREEAVRLAAAPLLRQGAITKEYVEAIIRVMHTIGPYFVYCPHVALAHAGPQDGVRRFGLTLMRLRNPVPFEHARHDPVSYVICLASDGSESRMQHILKLMSLMEKEETLREMDEIQNADVMLQYILEKEKEESYE